ncbi:MAG: alpha/beta hydrolase fold domain-containing protein [Marmoricola sp.]|nr:alpha/beta hydrolase fold domain-containing protein [Marmoricola sp.]
MSYRRRQLVYAALAANAVRPARSRYGAIPAFFAGWMATELAPQWLAVTALDAAAELTVRRRRGGKRHPDTLGLALAAGTAATLGYVILNAARSATHVETTLRRDLGEDYLDELEEAPSAEELKTSLRELVHPFKMTKPGVEVIRDVNYTAGGSRARLDIYRPADQDLRDAPVLVQVHGGGWTIGSKEQQGLLLMNAMAQRGWVCVAMNYRLAPKHPFPAQIVDVKKAIAWTREHIASYGGDPSYLVVTGGSAGGHLAALAALTPGDAEYQPGFEDADTSVAGCVPFYGVYDLAGLTGDRPAEELRDGFLAPWVFKKDPVADREAFVKASPLAHVSADAPDFFVLHGTNDSLVDVRQARAFVEKLKEVSKRTVTYAEFPGTQHAFEVFGSIRSHHVIKAVERWLLHHHALWTREQQQESAAG